MVAAENLTRATSRAPAAVVGGSLIAQSFIQRGKLRLGIFVHSIFVHSPRCGIACFTEQVILGIGRWQGVAHERSQCNSDSADQQRLLA